MFKKVDFFILIPLALTVALLSVGLRWGRIESWHPDDRSWLLPTESFSAIDFKLADYVKPPLYSYVVYFLVKAPLYYNIEFLHLEMRTFAEVELTLILVLNVIFFLSSLFFLYRSLQLVIKSKEITFFGTLLYGTTAGLHAFVRFTTVDTFLLFWTSLVTLVCTTFYKRKKTAYLYLSAFFIGAATATKYNGVILLSIPILLALGEYKGKVTELIKKLFLVFVFTTLGLIVSMPVIFVDGKKIIADFMYNLEISPVYHGGYNLKGYGFFFVYLAELIGWPLFTVCMASLALQLLKKRSPFLLVTVCFLLINYAYFGSYSMLPPRFLLHIVPALFVVGLMGVELAYSLFQNYHTQFRVILCGMLYYNLLCSLFLGLRFADNPRMNFQEWSKTHIPSNSVVFKSQYVPSIAAYSGLDVEEKLIEMKDITFLNEQLALSENDDVRKEELSHTLQESRLWLTRLEKLDGAYIPGDFIVIDSNWGYFQNKPLYLKLIAKGFKGCDRVFDESPKKVHTWMYPTSVDFLESRVTAFKCGK